MEIKFQNSQSSYLRDADTCNETIILHGKKIDDSIDPGASGWIVCSAMIRYISRFGDICFSDEVNSLSLGFESRLYAAFVLISGILLNTGINLHFILNRSGRKYFYAERS